VITGFRCAPGGAQQHFGITPDLATFAKIVAGGFPGGALAGRADLLRVMEFDGFSPPPVPHQGTFNATAISATAGIAVLKLIRSGGVIETVNRLAAALRDGVNAAIRRLGASWCVYGDFSGFHVYTNPSGESVSVEDIQAGKVDYRKLKGSMPPALMHKIRAGILVGGADVCPWPGGWLSSAHVQDDIDRTVCAFEGLLRMLAEEGDLALA
jgi:glutamate-1-semialdehyde 2,1-aminomutase